MTTDGNVTIADAKEIALRRRQRGVIVLAFGGGRFAASSYGMTRSECNAMRVVLEQISTMIESGEIIVPRVRDQVLTAASSPGETDAGPRDQVSTPDGVVSCPHCGRPGRVIGGVIHWTRMS